MDKDDVLSFLKGLAREAGQIMMEHIDGGYKVYTKPDRSRVTDVDLAISKLARRRIADAFPEIGLHSEESPDKKIIEGKPYFIIDELDGTSYFIDRKTGFSHQAAYYEPGAGLQVGLVYYPWNDTMAFAVRGGGAFVEAGGQVEQLEPLQEKPFHELIYSHPFRYRGDKYRELFGKMGVKDQRIVRTDASRTLLMARQQLDVNLFLVPRIPIWDLVGEKVIVEELGYHHSYLDGSSVKFGEQPPPGNRGYLICPLQWKDKFLTELPAILPSEYRR